MRNRKRPLAKEKVSPSLKVDHQASNDEQITLYDRIMFQTPEISFNISKCLAEEDKLNFRILDTSHCRLFQYFSEMDTPAIKLTLLKNDKVKQIEKLARGLNILKPSDVFSENQIDTLKLLSSYNPYVSSKSLLTYALSGAATFLCAPISIAMLYQATQMEDEEVNDFSLPVCLDFLLISSIAITLLIKRFQHDRNLQISYEKLRGLIADYETILEELNQNVANEIQEEAWDKASTKPGRN